MRMWDRTGTEHQPISLKLNGGEWRPNNWSYLMMSTKWDFAHMECAKVYVNCFTQNV